jgi:hypothetical protein
MRARIIHVGLAEGHDPLRKTRRTARLARQRVKIRLLAVVRRARVFLAFRARSPACK